MMSASRGSSEVKLPSSGKVSLLGIGLALVLAATSCESSTPGPPTRTPVPTPTPSYDTGFSTISQYSERINRARQTWESHNIASYRLVLEFYEGFARGLHTKREVIVKEGQVLASSCPSEECPAFVLAKVYTVEDLFAFAQGASRPSREKPEECIQGVQFDEFYGFPSGMSVDCPLVTDDEHWFRVVSFEVAE